MIPSILNVYKFSGSRKGGESLVSPLQVFVNVNVFSITKGIFHYFPFTFSFYVFFNICGINPIINYKLEFDQKI